MIAPSRSWYDLRVVTTFPKNNLEAAAFFVEIVPVNPGLDQHKADDQLASAKT